MQPAPRLSVVIADDDAPPSAFVMLRGFASSMRAAAELGFRGVELALRSATDVNPSELGKSLSSAGIEVSGISTGLVWAVDGLSLTDPDESVRDRAREVFTGLIDVAADYGGIVNMGRARGTVDPALGLQGTKERFASIVGELADHGQRKGVQLLIEPVNRYENNFLNSVTEVAAYIQDFGLPGVGIMADLFHMNIEDGPIAQTLVDNLSHVSYIHVADSDRRFPGSGHLDIAAIVNAVADAGYDGWYAAELLPEPSPEEAGRRTAEYMSRVFSRGGEASVSL